KYRLFISENKLQTQIEDDQTLTEEILMSSYDDINFYELRVGEDHRLYTIPKSFSIEDGDLVTHIGQRLDMKLPEGPAGPAGMRGRSNKINVVETFTLPDKEPAVVEFGESYPDPENEAFNLQDVIFKLPRGDKGDIGWSIDHKWEDTILFIKREDEIDWGIGTDLKGEKGDTDLFEGGIIVGDTQIIGHFDMKGMLSSRNQIVFDLQTIDDKTAMGYTNLIAKNTLQIGYQNGADGVSWDTNPLPQGYDQSIDKYSKLDAELIFHNDGGESRIVQNLSGELLVESTLLAIKSPLFTYKDSEVYTVLDADSMLASIALNFSTKEQTQIQDEIYFEYAKAYTDNAIGQADASQSIMEFVKTQDELYFVKSKDYTDEAIRLADVGMATKIYIDQKDVEYFGLAKK
ncbi:MAG: hypothetical protein ACRC6B_01985, partial [Fusobacteriaceae bacterium]